MRLYAIKPLALSLATSLLVAAAALPSFSTHADAAFRKCGRYADVVKLLETRYGETPRGVGLVAETSVMQVFVSPEKGTWSIVMTNRQGQSCLLAAGKDWEEVKQVQKLKGKPA